MEVKTQEKRSIETREQTNTKRAREIKNKRTILQHSFVRMHVEMFIHHNLLLRAQTHMI